MRELECGRIRIFHNGMPGGCVRSRVRLKFESTKLLRVSPELYARSTTVQEERVFVVSGSVVHDTCGAGTTVARRTERGAMSERIPNGLSWASMWRRILSRRRGQRAK